MSRSSPSARSDRCPGEYVENRIETLLSRWHSFTYGSRRVSPTGQEPQCDLRAPVSERFPMNAACRRGIRHTSVSHTYFLAAPGCGTSPQIGLEVSSRHEPPGFIARLVGRSALSLSRLTRQAARNARTSQDRGAAPDREIGGDQSRVEMGKTGLGLGLRRAYMAISRSQRLPVVGVAGQLPRAVKHSIRYARPHRSGRSHGV